MTGKKFNPYTLSLLLSAIALGLGILTMIGAYSILYSKSLALATAVLFAIAILLASQGDYIIGVISSALLGRSIFIEEPVELQNDLVLRQNGDKYIAMSLLKVVPTEVYIDMTDAEKQSYLTRISSFLMSVREPVMIGAFALPVDMKGVIDRLKEKEANLRKEAKKAKEEKDDIRRAGVEDDRKYLRNIMKKIESTGAISVVYFVSVSGEGFTKEHAIAEVERKREALMNSMRGVLGAQYIDVLRGRKLLRFYQMMLAVPVSIEEPLFYGA